MMRGFVLVGVLILSSAAIAVAAEPLTGNPKPVAPQKSIPLAGEEPYEALKRGDFRVAAGLFYPLAQRGDARAQYNLGLLYASGLGVEQDYQAALKWHRMAAAQGHAGGQNELAQMYAKGQGVQPNQVLAYVWFSAAIASSSSGSKTEITKDRDRTASRMTPEQIAKAQQIAEQCEESKFKKCGEK
jgi:TPR repeat protein